MKNLFWSRHMKRLLRHATRCLCIGNQRLEKFAVTLQRPSLAIHVKEDLTCSTRSNPWRSCQTWQQLPSSSTRSWWSAWGWSPMTCSVSSPRTSFMNLVKGSKSALHFSSFFLGARLQFLAIELLELLDDILINRITKKGEEDTSCNALNVI